MNLTTLPRAAAKLEYNALRMPLSILERRFIATRLSDDASLRLGFEKALGSLDLLAGQLLGDDELSRRGQALTHRADRLRKTTALEAKAEQRQREAAEKLEQRTDEAERDRQAAQSQERERLAAIRGKEQADKQQARRQAQAREQAEKRRVEKQTQAKIAQAETAKSSKLKQVDARKNRATAPARKQLADASANQTQARAKKMTADQLGQLAAKERVSRQAR
jgi:hypothetical protein